MPHIFKATTSKRLNIEDRKKAGAQRVDKIEQFLQNCVEENIALTGCLIYRTSDNPIWRGFGMVLNQCPVTTRRYGQQIYHFLEPTSDEHITSPSSSSSAGSTGSFPDDPQNIIADVLKILTTDIITVGLHIQPRNFKVCKIGE